MTTKEAAALWGCGWQTVKLLVRQGRVEGAYKVGHTWVIPDWAPRPPALPRGRVGVVRTDGASVGSAPQRADIAALRAQAADRLADIVQGDPEAEWARYALKAVLRQGVEPYSAWFQQMGRSTRK